MPILFILSAVLLGVSSCGGQSAEEYSDKDTATLYMLANPVTLNPVSSTDLYGLWVFEFIFDSLIDINENLDPVPSIAKSWDWKTEYGRTNTNYVLTFHLRDDVYWHDGVKCDARDFAYTYEKIMDPRSKAFNAVANYEGLVASVTTPDDYTLRIAYRQPYAAAVLTWQIYPLPKHLYADADFLKTEYNRKPVGNGPYRLVKWEPTKYIKMERNESYWRKKPLIKRIIYKIITDPNVAFSTFRSGQLDLYPMLPEQYISEKDKPYFTNQFNLYKYLYYSLGFDFIAWNCSSKSLFGNKNVRRAMTYAIDRESIAKNFLHGLANVVTGPFYEKSWAYDSSIKPIPFNLEKAKELLLAAGWKDNDSDGILEKDGKPFRFELVLSDRPVRKAIALNLKENLSRIGVDMQIRVLEWSALIKRLDERNFEAILIGESLSTDPDPYVLFHSSQITVGANHNEFSNAQADRLMEEGRRLLDKDMRQTVYHRLHRLFDEEQPYSFLFCHYELDAARKNLKGIRITPAGIKGFYPGAFGWYKE